MKTLKQFLNEMPQMCYDTHSSHSYLPEFKLTDHDYTSLGSVGNVDLHMHATPLYRITT